MKILRPRSKLPAREEGGGSPASGHTGRAVPAWQTCLVRHWSPPDQRLTVLAL
jgi:hypothetical protein